MNLYKRYASGVASSPPNVGVFENPKFVNLLSSKSSLSLVFLYTRYLFSFL